MKTPHCPECQVAMRLKFNPRGGGRFFGCENFEAAGCPVWCSPTTGKFGRLADTVARASRLHGRVSSLRQKMVRQLTTKCHFNVEEAEEMIDNYGVDRVQWLLAV